MKRRDLLKALGALAATGATIGRVNSAELRGYPSNMAVAPEFLPRPGMQGGKMHVLTDDSALRTVTAVFDRLIPADEFGPSASEAGCVVFLDSQLADRFGQGAQLYREGPKLPGADELTQEPQFIATPRERYETGLKALDAYALKTDGAAFAELQPDRQDEILKGMEDGSVSLGKDINTKAFFELMLQNVREGYFADPIYGGNKDMVGWKLIGFPGARYDYRPYVDQVGKKLNLIPVSLIPRD